MYFSGLFNLHVEGEKVDKNKSMLFLILRTKVLFISQ